MGCHLNVLEATDHDMKTFLRVKGNTYTMVPIGTKIYLNADSINKLNVLRQKDFDIFSITVQKIEEVNGKPLHICTTIHKETRAEMRGSERRDVHFPVSITNSSSLFETLNGCSEGLSLLFKPNRAMVSLSLDRSYQFSVQFREEDYFLDGNIRHIQYDWATHHHIIGVHFPNLTKDQEILLNRLIDPEYKINISTKSSIDSAAGKISIDD